MNVLRLVDKVFLPQTVFAHCDVPCGIYDPHLAQVAAHTVLRMTNMIDELQASSPEPPFEERKRIISQISRLTKVKEEHAELVKHEIRVIWGDYLKDEHLKQHKAIHQLVFKIMKQASVARQNVDIKAANELLEMVQMFAEIFWETKDRRTQRIKSGYPTDGEIVLPK